MWILMGMIQQWWKNIKQKKNTCIAFELIRRNESVCVSEGLSSTYVHCIHVIFMKYWIMESNKLKQLLLTLLWILDECLFLGSYVRPGFIPLFLALMSPQPHQLTSISYSREPILSKHEIMKVFQPITQLWVIFLLVGAKPDASVLKTGFCSLDFLSC